MCIRDRDGSGCLVDDMGKKHKVFNCWTGAVRRTGWGARAPSKAIVGGGG